MKNIKYFIPSIIIMMVIFSFSLQTGDESSGLSSLIVAWIYQNLHISVSEFIVRKAAHMSEYAMLTWSLIYGFYKSGFSLRNIVIHALLITFLYACSDEAHQLFVSGRAGQLSDILIDTSGGLMASLLYFIYAKRRT
ncbi:MAG: VanZ family protein [Erysipelotrichaceae bacterium]|nr:VanZ family protein [Erysipelotrichaceae bacterium]